MLYKIIAKRIKEAREAAGISQKKLAEKTGIGQAALSFYETAVRKISKRNLLKISEYLNKPLSFFYSEIPEELIELERMGIGITAKEEKGGKRTYHLGLPMFEKKYTSLLMSLKETKTILQKDPNMNEKEKRVLISKCKIISSLVDNLWDSYILIQKSKK